jgi:hypothetical protein
MLTVIKVHPAKVLGRIDEDFDATVGIANQSSNQVRMTSVSPEMSFSQ